MTGTYVYPAKTREKIVNIIDRLLKKNIFYSMGKRKKQRRERVCRYIPTTQHMVKHVQGTLLRNMLAWTGHEITVEQSEILAKLVVQQIFFSNMAIIKQDEK